jgi:hypothetical protein
VQDLEISAATRCQSDCGRLEPQLPGVARPLAGS